MNVSIKLSPSHCSRCSSFNNNIGGLTSPLQQRHSGYATVLPSSLVAFPRLQYNSKYFHKTSTTVAASSSKGFHLSRLSADNSAPAADLPALQLDIRMAERDDELEAASWLRARSFYAYPPERQFAGNIHQGMVAEEEFNALKEQRLQRKLAEGSEEPVTERSACIIAACKASDLSAEGKLDERLLFTDDGETQLALVGTLDVYAVRALPGEVLIGSSSNAAYLANVCTSTAARRRGVGASLLSAARAIALKWGVDSLYVHTMAVNEIAMGFYQSIGFVVEQEESSNTAHYRGRCLDGIEGAGRTVLLRDSKLHDHNEM